MRPLHNRRSNPRASQRRPAPLRAVERLEARELPAISITNLALSGGPISEATPTVRTLSGALAVPPIADVDLAITWGDGSAVQHITVAGGGTNFSVNHSFNFTGDNPANSASYPFTVSVAASYAHGQVFTGPSAAGYVAATVPFLSYNLQAGQAGVVDLAGHGTDTFVGLNLGADSFRFMGSPRTGKIYVGSDGYVTFGSGNTSAGSDGMGDNSALNQAALAPLWAGWRIGHHGRLLAKTLDLNHDGHNDWLLIQWDNVKQVRGTGRATFQVALQLNSGATDGDVWFNYVSNTVTSQPIGTSVGVKNVDRGPANPLVVSHSLTDAHVAGGHALLVSNSATTTTAVTGTVVNVPPTLTSLALNRSTIDEGSAVNLSGQFTDPGPLDTFTVGINWGDGHTQTVSRGVGAQDFGPVGHTYQDNGVYTLSVFVTDDDGGKSNTRSLPVTVNNVAPALSNLALDKTVVGEGGAVTLTGRITDPGALDTFTVQVDWGDGTTSQQNYGAGAPLNFSLQHTYADADASPGGLMNVRVHVKDKDMTSFGAYQPVGAVQVNNVPPTIAGLAVTTPVNEGDVATLTGSVVDPSPGDTFTLTVNWGDGTVDTFTPQAGAINYSHRYLNNPTGAPAGSYTLKVDLTDDDGGQFNAQTSVAVHDVAPLNLALTSAPVNEGSPATLRGTFSDPGILDAHAVSVAWGDGVTNTISLAAGVTSFSATHVYLDEAAAAAGYRVTVTVADDDGLTTSGQTDVLVNNVAPSNLQLGVAPTAIDENGTTALAGSFADPGTLDTHSVTVAWGDRVTDSFTLAAGVTSFSGHTHQYLDDNSGAPYTVTVTLADDDGGTAGATTAVQVNNVAPSNIQLTVTPATVDENGTASLGGTFADPGSLDSHSVTIAWGDGATDSFALAAGVTSFSGKTHQYLDDNPNGPYVVTVTVADASSAASGTAAVQVNNVAPSNLALTASPSSVNEGAPVTLGGTFSDPGTLDTHAIAVSWGDGATDSFALAAGVTSFHIAHVYQDEAPAATGEPIAVAVTDNGGLGTTGQTDVPVYNVAPSNLQLAVSPATIDENGSTALAGSFADPGTLDTHVVTVAWGDGATNSFALAAGVTGFSGQTHQYLDDNSRELYTVNVTVADDDGGTTSGTTAVQVNNVAPTITSVSATPATINEGQAVTLTGSFTDPGTLDTFSAAVNWGDGATGPAAVSGHSFSATHVYDDGASPSSSLTVAVTVNDNGGGSATGSTKVSVANVAPTATFASTGPYVAGVPITIRFSTPFDPSAADTAAGFKYSYDFNNDGIFDIVDSSSPTATHAFPGAGSYTLKGRITDKDGGFTDLTTNVTIGPASIIAVGANAGNTPRVQVFDAITGALKFDFLAYAAAFTGGVRVAVADVTGDGVPDIITAAGLTAPHVEVWDGVTGNLDFSFFAFNVFNVPTGVTIAAGDFNGDGKADLVIGTNLGGGGLVELLDGSKLDQVQPNGQIAAPAIMRTFTPYPGFNGEIRVAAGDVTGDGVPDIITGAGPFGGPHVQVFNGVTNAVVYSFMAFDGSFTGGVYVAAGDLDGDGHADLIVSQGAGFQAQVHTYSGATGIQTGTVMPFADLAPLPNGVTVMALDRDGDGKAEILVGTGQGPTPLVRTLNGTTLTMTSQFQPFDPSFLGGVFVG